MRIFNIYHHRYNIPFSRHAILRHICRRCCSRVEYKTLAVHSLNKRMRLLCAGCPVDMPQCYKDCTAEWLHAKCRARLAHYNAMLTPNATAKISPSQCMSLNFNGVGDDECRTLHVPESSASFVLEIVAEVQRASHTAPEVEEEEWPSPEDTEAFLE